MNKSNSEKINTLQAGRALAALGVVVHHAASSAVDFIGAFPAKLGQVLEYGWIGVDFFFVLSGFIIYHTTRGKSDGLQGARIYARSRATRIFIPYLPIGIFMVLIYTFLPSLSGSDRAWSALASLTLLPVGNPALSVAWTLQHEIVFYAIFALGFFTGQLRLTIAAWSVAILAAMVLGGHDMWVPLKVILAPINLEFMFGMGCAVLVSQRSPQPVGAFLALAAVAFILWAALSFSRTMSPLAALGIAALLVPIVRSERRGQIRVPAWLLYLGEASYAIYLVHNPLLSVTTRLAARVRIMSDVYVATILGIIVAVCVGCLYYSLVEKPARSLVLRKFRHVPAMPR